MARCLEENTFVASVGSLLDRAPQVNAVMTKGVWSPGTEIK